MQFGRLLLAAQRGFRRISRRGLAGINDGSSTTLVDHFAHEEELNFLFHKLRNEKTVHALYGSKSIGKSNFAAALSTKWTSMMGSQVLYLDFSTASGPGGALYSAISRMSTAGRVATRTSERVAETGLSLDMSFLKVDAPGATRETVTDSARSNDARDIDALVEQFIGRDLQSIWSGAVGLVIIDEAQSIEKLGVEWAEAFSDTLERVAGRYWRLPVLLITSDYDMLVRKQGKLARSIMRLHVLCEQSEASAARHWAAIVAKAAEAPGAREPPPFSAVWAEVGGHPGHLEMLGRGWCTSGETDLHAFFSSLQSAYTPLARAAVAPAAPASGPAAEANSSAAASARASVAVISALLKSRAATSALGGVPLSALPPGSATAEALQRLCRAQQVSVLHALPLKPGPTGFNYKSPLPLVQFASTLESRAAERSFSAVAAEAAKAAQNTAAAVAEAAQKTAAEAAETAQKTAAAAAETAQKTAAAAAETAQKAAAEAAETLGVL